MRGHPVKASCWRRLRTLKYQEDVFEAAPLHLTWEAVIHLSSVSRLMQGPQPRLGNSLLNRATLVLNKLFSLSPFQIGIQLKKNDSVLFHTFDAEIFRYNLAVIRKENGTTVKKFKGTCKSVLVQLIFKYQIKQRKQQRDGKRLLILCTS